MAGLLQLSLIRFFGFYLAVMFLVGTLLRVRQYRTFLNLVRAMPGRWPRLLKLVRQHGHIFLTWGTVMPLVLSLSLVLANWVASTLLWPQANDFTVARLLEAWPAVPVVLTCAVGMLVLDTYCCVVAGEVNQAEMEKYFDQAEYWLRSWTAPVVHFFTLGYINPRQMVAIEVRSALVSASQLLNSTLWWVVAQTGLRILFGLALWGSYALEPWLRG